MIDWDDRSAGKLTGNLTGDLTGDLTGGLTGNLTEVVVMIDWPEPSPLDWTQNRGTQCRWIFDWEFDSEFDSEFDWEFD